MILAVWIACAPEAPVQDGLTLEEAVRVRVGGGDQHHATAALGPDGEALVAFQERDWIVVAPLPDGASSAEGWRPFDEVASHHPQIAAGREGFLLVGSDRSGALVARTLDWDGRAAGAVLSPGAGLHPDLAVGAAGGLVVWGDEAGLGRWAFTGDLEGGAPLAPLERGVGVGTPTVRPRQAGFLAAWGERGPGYVGLVRVALDSNGEPVEPPEEVAAWDVFEDDPRPVLAVGTRGDALAWRLEGPREVWLQLRDADGAVLDEVALHDGGAAGRPALAAAGDTVYAVWERGSEGGWDVVLQRFDLTTGETRGPVVEVARATGVPGRPYVEVRQAGDEVRGLVTWEAGPSGHRTVWARAFVTRPR